MEILFTKYGDPRCPRSLRDCKSMLIEQSQLLKQFQAHGMKAEEDIVLINMNRLQKLLGWMRYNNLLKAYSNVTREYPSGLEEEWYNKDEIDFDMFEVTHEMSCSASERCGKFRSTLYTMELPSKYWVDFKEGYNELYHEFIKQVAANQYLSFSRDQKQRDINSAYNGLLCRVSEHIFRDAAPVLRPHTGALFGDEVDEEQHYSLERTFDSFDLAPFFGLCSKCTCHGKITINAYLEHREFNVYDPVAASGMTWDTRLLCKGTMDLDASLRIRIHVQFQVDYHSERFLEEAGVPAYFELNSQARFFPYLDEEYLGMYAMIDYMAGLEDSEGDSSEGKRSPSGESENSEDNSEKDSEGEGDGSGEPEKDSEGEDPARMHRRRRQSQGSSSSSGEENSARRLPRRRKSQASVKSEDIPSEGESTYESDVSRGSATDFSCGYIKVPKISREDGRLLFYNEQAATRLLAERQYAICQGKTCILEMMKPVDFFELELDNDEIFWEQAWTNMPCYLEFVSKDNRMIASLTNEHYKIAMIVLYNVHTRIPGTEEPSYQSLYRPESHPQHEPPHEPFHQAQPDSSHSLVYAPVPMPQRRVKHIITQTRIYINHYDSFTDIMITNIEALRLSQENYLRRAAGGAGPPNPLNPPRANMDIGQTPSVPARALLKELDSELQQSILKHNSLDIPVMTGVRPGFSIAHETPYSHFKDVDRVHPAMQDLSIRWSMFVEDFHEIRKYIQEQVDASMGENSFEKLADLISLVNYPYQWSNGNYRQYLYMFPVAERLWNAWWKSPVGLDRVRAIGHHLLPGGIEYAQIAAKSPGPYVFWYKDLDMCQFRDSYVEIVANLHHRRVEDCNLANFQGNVIDTCREITAMYMIFKELETFRFLTPLMKKEWVRWAGKFINSTIYQNIFMSAVMFRYILFHTCSNIQMHEQRLLNQPGANRNQIIEGLLNDPKFMQDIMNSVLKTFTKLVMIKPGPGDPFTYMYGFEVLGKQWTCHNQWTTCPWEEDSSKWKFPPIERTYEGPNTEEHRVNQSMYVYSSQLTMFAHSKWFYDERTYKYEIILKTPLKSKMIILTDCETVPSLSFQPSLLKMEALLTAHQSDVLKTLTKDSLAMYGDIKLLRDISQEDVTQIKSLVTKYHHLIKEAGSADPSHSDAYSIPDQGIYEIFYVLMKVYAFYAKKITGPEETTAAQQYLENFFEELAKNGLLKSMIATYHEKWIFKDSVYKVFWSVLFEIESFYFFMAPGSDLIGPAEDFMFRHAGKAPKFSEWIKPLFYLIQVASFVKSGFEDYRTLSRREQVSSRLPYIKELYVRLPYFVRDCPKLVNFLAEAYISIFFKARYPEKFEGDPDYTGEPDVKIVLQEMDHFFNLVGTPFIYKYFMQTRTNQQELNQMLDKLKNAMLEFKPSELVLKSGHDKNLFSKEFAKFLTSTKKYAKILNSDLKEAEEDPTSSNTSFLRKYLSRVDSNKH